jgi:hypothetical protein
MPSVSIIPGLTEFTRIFFGAQFPCQRFRHRVHGRLRRAVDRRAGQRLHADDGADVDDTAAVAVEMFQRLLRREDQAEHVQIELLPEMVLGDLFQRRELLNAGVVHENVNAAERFPGFGK